MDAAEDLRRRVEELENQAAFQDELHHRLNDIVARQDRELQELKQQLRELGRHLAEVREAGGGGAPGPQDEVPPHY